MQPLRVHSSGDPAAPPLVLAHGLTDAGTAWPDAVARWSPRWRVHAVDLRGHGRSPRFDVESMQDMLTVFADDLLAVLDDVGPAPVVGHSLGGRVAAAAALTRPDAVRALVLEDPALTDGPALTPDFAAEQHRFLDAFADGGDAERARMRTATPWSEAEIDAWAECKPLVDRLMIDHLDLGPLDSRTAFAALACPTLVLYDADGPLGLHAAPTTNPLVDVRHLDGVGHCIRRDDPALFHGIVDPWLDAHGR